MDLHQDPGLQDLVLDSGSRWINMKWTISPTPSSPTGIGQVPAFMISLGMPVSLLQPIPHITQQNRSMWHWVIDYSEIHIH